MFEMILLMWRNCLRGFCHGFFLSNYKLQLITLIITDGLLLLMTLIFVRKFLNIPTTIIYILYSMALMIFDFILYAKEANFPSMVNYQLLIMILIFVLIGLTVLKILIALFDSFRDIYLMCKDKNKVIPEITEKKTITKKEEPRIQEVEDEIKSKNPVK